MRRRIRPTRSLILPARAWRGRGGALVILALALVATAPVPPYRAEAQAPGPSAPTPAPIPVAEVTRQADEVGAFLRSLDEQLPPSPHIARIEQELAPLSERLSERFDQTKRTIESRPGLGTLDALADSWRSSRVGLVTWMETVTGRANWLEQQRAQLAKLVPTWTRTRAELRAAKVPPELSQRAADILAALASAQAMIEPQRATTLVLQDRVARELTRADTALAEIVQARQRAAYSLLVRESPPIWSLRPLPPSALPAVIAASFGELLGALRSFAHEQSDRIVLHVALLLGLVAFLWWARGRARRLTAAERAAQSLALVFDQPVAAALVLGMLSAFWIYADEPRTARLVVELGAFPSMVLILRRLVAPAMRPVLYVMSAFFLVDIVRDLVVPLSLLERALFLLEMMMAAALLGWLIRSGRTVDLIAARAGSAIGHARGFLLKLALVGSLVALVAGIVGNMSLARLIGSGILSSGYLALVLIAGRRLAEGLVTFALRVPPFAYLRMVEHHGARLEERARVLLRTLSTIGWAIGTLDYFGGLTPAIAGTRRVLGASLTLGALGLSLGDVLAFVLTVYLAYLVSSLIQFVLAEDVFPRLNLRPGLPYALSSLVRYAIVFVGFLLALVALGVNLDRVTVLGGALGVGVGFGLQNIVNNFVSGLIVLFERPIRVGDAVQIGDVQGEVRRIGIRSTTVRSWEGAEVIVPNATLVSDKVTNWTPFSSLRRVDIRVNVAYGSAPDAVLKVLAEVARAHPDVVAQPPTAAVFLGFGDSALMFELRTWTNRLDRHVDVKSELGIAVYAAFREAGFSIPFPQQEVRLHQAPPAAP